MIAATRMQLMRLGNIKVMGEMLANNMCAIIVVPTYKENLNPFEKASLMQLRKVLGKYECCFVAPESLAMDYGLDFQNFKTERFDDHFFSSIASYSELLMSEEFYGRFDDFDYMLVYQLDAFVFEDRLTEFCSYGYDYIGAPVPYRMRHKNHHVENGGFSLRKIKSFLKVLSPGKAAIKGHCKENVYLKLEDQFFSFCGSQPELNFRIAPYDVAFRFSLEYDFGKCYENFPKQLPFGCHRWYTGMSYKFLPMIRSLGYDLPYVDMEAFKKEIGDGHKIFIADFLIKRLIRNDNINLSKKIFNKAFATLTGQDDNSGKIKYAIWGYGKIGKQAAENLGKMGMSIACIYDKHAAGNKIIDGHCCTYPNENEIKKSNYYIIITSSKYQKDISEELKSFGLTENTNFCAWNDLKWKIAKQYLVNVWNM